MTVLITGGAGYIGSHMVQALVEAGEPPVVLDNLSTGIRDLVNQHAIFVQGDIADSQVVRSLIQKHQINAVIHFAGSVVVPESVENPTLYYENNTSGSLRLIQSCIAMGVRHFVFSSTAAVYGAATEPKVSEDYPKEPINPYGRSKLMTEWVLEDVSRAHDFRYHILRYFNVAGADPLGRTGQSTPRATHLIKRACQAALGRVGHLDIFGTDFETPDGTGVRDYIHVTDLVSAHLLALNALRDGAKSTVYNCGYGRGLSVRDIIKAVETITGNTVPTREMPRRAGDPAMLIANSERLIEALKWEPRHADIQTIVSTAFEWEKQIKG
jgi:UDP-glucose 4-epimerase